MAGFLSSIMNKLGLSEQEADAGPLTEALLRQWMTEQVAERLKISPAEVDPFRSFESYGLGSLEAIKLAGDLEKLIEQRLTPALLFEHPSIDVLAKHLASELGLAKLS